MVGLNITNIFSHFCGLSFTTFNDLSIDSLDSNKVHFINFFLCNYICALYEICFSYDNVMNVYIFLIEVCFVFHFKLKINLDLVFVYAVTQRSISLLFIWITDRSKHVY